jgi:hypothetical protein
MAASLIEAAVRDKKLADVVVTLRGGQARIMLALLIRVCSYPHARSSRLIDARSITQFQDQVIAAQGTAKHAGIGRLASICPPLVIRLMTKLALQSNQMPDAIYIHGVALFSYDVVGYGGSADVFRGRWRNGLVALKRLRVFSDPARFEAKRVHIPW